LLANYFYLANIITNVWFHTSAKHFTTNPPHHGVLCRNHHEGFITTSQTASPQLKTTPQNSRLTSQSAKTKSLTTAKPKSD